MSIYESDVNVREGEIIIAYVLPSMWMCVKVKYASIYIIICTKCEHVWRWNICKYVSVNVCEGEIWYVLTLMWTCVKVKYMWVYMYMWTFVNMQVYVSVNMCEGENMWA